MMLRIDSGLHVIADDSGASAAGRHGAGIGIGQRNLLVRRGEHSCLKCMKALHLLLQLRDLLLQAGRLGIEHLGRPLPVGAVELL